MSLLSKSVTSRKPSFLYQILYPNLFLHQDESHCGLHQVQQLDDYKQGQYRHGGEPGQHKGQRHTQHPQIYTVKKEGHYSLTSRAQGEEAGVVEAVHRHGAGHYQQQILRQARKEREEIVGQARKERENILEQARQEASVQAASILDDAHTMIEREKQRAKDDLRRDLAGISVSLAEKVLGEELKDADAQRKSIEKSIEEVTL